MKQRLKVESKFKVLPDHLIRAPVQKNAKKTSAFVSAQKLLELSTKGKKMSTRAKKQALEEAKVQDLEIRRKAIAMKAQKLLFDEFKRLLEQPEGTQFHPKLPQNISVRAAKDKVISKCFVSWLYQTYSQYSKGSGINKSDSLMNKSDFGAFAKEFTNNALRENDINEFMQYYARIRALAVRKSLGKSTYNET